MYNRTVTQVPIALSGAATTQLVAAPGARLKIYVTTIVLVATAAGTYRFEEVTGGVDLSGDISLAANGGLVVAGSSDDDPCLNTNAANTGLQVVHGAAAAGWIRYFVAA